MFHIVNIALFVLEGGGSDGNGGNSGSGESGESGESGGSGGSSESGGSGGSGESGGSKKLLLIEKLLLLLHNHLKKNIK